ncbi:unnamed protein product [Nesidiocoris tenuis]|uniref:Uncharacterized protein n=1 Tax=Nesidiocoris tenuis TaxID=355587 RepID=A0A6H5GXT7_9HEMI|nr:unnamed protein product [Nesidiocoris tenuis]
MKSNETPCRENYGLLRLRVCEDGDPEGRVEGDEARPSGWAAPGVKTTPYAYPIRHRNSSAIGSERTSGMFLPTCGTVLGGGAELRCAPSERSRSIMLRADRVKPAVARPGPSRIPPEPPIRFLFLNQQYRISPDNFLYKHEIKNI